MNNNKPYFVFDIDGTLMKPSQSHFDQEGIEAIKLASKYGKVVLATARPLTGVLNILPKSLLHLDFIIALNGALTYSNSKTTNIIPLSPNFINHLIENKAKFKNLWFFSQDNWYANDMTTSECKKEEISIQSSCSHIDTYKEFEMILKVTIVDEVDNNNFLKSLCENKFNQTIYYANSHSNFHEFNSISTNKYLAIKVIADGNKYYAIGDSDNDIEILQNSDFGCCVGNSSFAAKQSSKYISPLEFGKGAYDCLNRIIKHAANEHS